MILGLNIKNAFVLNFFCFEMILWLFVGDVKKTHTPYCDVCVGIRL